MNWTPEPPRPQSALPTKPYDRWMSPEGVCMAEFHRIDGGFLIRWPGQADFELMHQTDSEAFDIRSWPVPDCDVASVVNLYHNAIEPLLGNYNGGLFLHGSAVRLGNAAEDNRSGAVAFLGLSRGGKTTLAGSFAKQDYPFLTEDVIDLKLAADEYQVQPKRSKLRLFADSAQFLFGEQISIKDANLKQDVEAAGALPFSKKAAPLRQIYVLGTDHNAPLTIRRLPLQEALTALMPHAFVLDVEDRKRLNEHFVRMGDLAMNVQCYALDFTRDYAELPHVCSAVIENFNAGCQAFWGGRTAHAAG